MGWIRCSGHFHNEAAHSFAINSEVLQEYLRTIYKGFDTSDAIEPTMWRAVLKVLNEATVEGLSRSHTDTHDRKFLSSLRHSNEVFAAFKVHSMGEKMAEKLLDDKGKLKPFREWKEDVKGIASHYVGSWLETGYNTAVIRAHNAADWQQFERDADIMPNLRWMLTTSPHPESSHKKFWERQLTLPVSNPFWDKHHPGDRWNCKCSLEQTDEPATPELKEEFRGEKPQRGLANNPGKDGRMFSQDHPYFPKSCSKCSFNKGLKNRVRTFFRNGEKDCYKCANINNVMKSSQNDLKHKQDVPPPASETYEVISGGKVLTSPYHGTNEVDENKRLAEFISKKTKRKVYLLPRLDPLNPREAILRPILLPEDVFADKNPDFYIGGMLFDGKSMLNVFRTTDKNKHHNDILNRIKAAKKQANNIVIEIPSFISRKTIKSTIKGFLKQSSQDRIVIVKHGIKCYIYDSNYL